MIATGNFNIGIVEVGKNFQLTEEGGEGKEMIIMMIVMTTITINQSLVINRHLLKADIELYVKYNMNLLEALCCKCNSQFSPRNYRNKYELPPDLSKAGLRAILPGLPSCGYEKLLP